MRLVCMVVLLAACHPFGDEDQRVVVIQADMGPPDPSVPDPVNGCSNMPKPPLGTHGLVAFYLGWPDARVTAPFAAGSRSQIVTQAVGHDRRVASVASSDPSVLSLTMGPPFQACAFVIIDLIALAPGHASILLFDKGGEVIDAFPVDVAPTARLALDPEQLDETVYVGASGAALQAHVITEAADGTTLHGLGAVGFAGSGAVYDVAAMGSAFDTGDPFDFGGAGDFVQLRIAPGDGVLTLSAPGAARGITLHGTLGDEIDGLSIDKSALVESTKHPGQWSTKVGVHATCGGHRVSAMKCDLLDLDTTGFLPDLQPMTLGVDAKIDLEILATPGDYTISCTIGSQVATLPLHIP